MRWSPAKVAHRLGHTNPKITLETYSHLIPEEENEVAEIFHSALNPCVNRVYTVLRNSRK